MKELWKSLSEVCRNILLTVLGVVIIILAMTMTRHYKTLMTHYTVLTAAIEKQDKETTTAQKQIVAVKQILVELKSLNDAEVNAVVDRYMIPKDSEKQ